jgi:pyruvate/2-oxoglutarate/acetoin dehydrogenase E1 component
VIRAPFGAGGGNAAQHSQSFESWFNHVPGIKVCAPITPYDIKGMLIAAIRDDNPVIFFEHKRSYQMKGEVPDEAYTIDLGKAAVRRTGSHVTIVSYSMMALKALEAATELEREGISCEVIDLRTIVPCDYETIMSSIAKTHRVVIVQEANLRGGFASDVVAEIVERGFDTLEAPPVRVGGLNVPMPYNQKLEETVIPNTEKIIRAVKTTLDAA